MEGMLGRKVYLSYIRERILLEKGYSRGEVILGSRGSFF